MRSRDLTVVRLRIFVRKFGTMTRLVVLFCRALPRFDFGFAYLWKGERVGFAALNRGVGQAQAAVLGVGLRGRVDVF